MSIARTAKARNFVRHFGVVHRVGSPHKFRVVGIDDSQAGSTRFGLVYLELPKDKDSDEKSK